MIHLNVLKFGVDMKRIFTILATAALSVIFTVNASAQFNYGLIGGATFSSAKPNQWKLTKETEYHIGATFKLSLPLGFAVQPSLMYQVKGTGVPAEADGNGAFDYAAGYLEVPVSVQWGPDLLIMRPYFECVPFFGYALNNKYKGGSGSVKNNWTGLNRWEYGLGVGVGLEVWHLQISARYNWDLGTLFDAKSEITDADSFAAKMKESVGDKSRFGGVTVSVAVLF